MFCYAHPTSMTSLKALKKMGIAIAKPVERDLYSKTGFKRKYLILLRLGVPF